MNFNNFISDLLLYNKICLITPYSFNKSQNKIIYTKITLYFYYLISIIFFITCWYGIYPVLESINGAVIGVHRVVNVTTVLDILRCSICYQIIIYNQLKNSDKQIELFRSFEQIDDKIINKLKWNELNYKELRWFYKFRFYLTFFYFMVAIKSVSLWTKYIDFFNLTLLLFLLKSTVIGIVGNFISTVLLMIWIRFKIINKKLIQISDGNEAQLIFEIHEKLCDLIRKFNKIFGFTILIILSSYLFLLIFVGFTLYWLLTTDNKLENEYRIIQFVTNLLWGIPCLVEITSLGLFSHLITSEVVLFL